MSKKTIIYILIVLSILFSCQKKSTDVASKNMQDDGDKPKIMFVSPLVAHPVWLKAKEGFEQAAKDLDFDGQWVGPQGLDVNEMVKQIEIAINLGSDGIITQGLVPEALEPVLKSAAAAGIPVVLVDADVPRVERLAFLGLNPDDFGRIGGNAILQAMKDKAIVGGGIVPNIEHKIANDIIQSYIDTLTDHSAGFRHTTILESKSDTMTAVTRFEEMLNTYPNLNVFYCTGAETAAAAANVLREKDKKGDVLIMGIDDVDETLEQIKEGYVYGTLAVNFYRYGYQSSQILMDYILSDKRPPRQIINIPPILVTQDNITNYNTDAQKPETW